MKAVGVVSRGGIIAELHTFLMLILGYDLRYFPGYFIRAPAKHALGRWIPRRHFTAQARADHRHSRRLNGRAETLVPTLRGGFSRRAHKFHNVTSSRHEPH